MWHVDVTAIQKIMSTEDSYLKTDGMCASHVVVWMLLIITNTMRIIGWNAQFFCDIARAFLQPSFIHIQHMYYISCLMEARLHLLLKPVKCLTSSVPIPALLLQSPRIMSMLQYLLCVCVCVFHDYLITVKPCFVLSVLSTTLL